MGDYYKHSFLGVTFIYNLTIQPNYVYTLIKYDFIYTYIYISLLIQIDTNLFDEISRQTGCDKYSIIEATISFDIVKKLHSLVIRVDEYEDYKLIRKAQIWSQSSFGGTT
jgi:hypothetical protein